MRWATRFDPVQPPVIATLLLIGLATVYSAAPGEFASQAAWAAATPAIYILATAAGHHRVLALAPALYAAAILALIGVHLGGHAALGARRWLALGAVRLEPAELAKIAVIAVVARVLAVGEAGTRAALAAAGLTAIPAVLVLLEPDLGTALVFAAVLAAMLAVSRVRLRILAGLGAVAAGAVPVLLGSLHGYQRRRLQVFWDPGSDPLGAGYNVLQARIAVGSGGLFGQGWLHGAQGRLGFLPERSTDFIFAVFAEEFGLAGCILLLALFGVLVLRVCRVAAAASGSAGRLLAAGVGAMVAFQVIQNVGMCLGLTPVAGIPLPLISRGGSSLWATAAALGLVQSVLFRRPPLVHAPAARLGLVMISGAQAPRPAAAVYNHSSCPSRMDLPRPS